MGCENRGVSPTQHGSTEKFPANLMQYPEEPSRPLHWQLPLRHPSQHNSPHMDMSLPFVWQLLIYVLLQAVAIYVLEVGAIFFCLASLFFMLTNLGVRKEGELSAYPAFNKGGIRLPGSLEFESQLRHGPPGTPAYGQQPAFEPVVDDASADIDDADDAVIDSDGRSELQQSISVALLRGGKLNKVANQPCACGSGAKTKKCCGHGAALRWAQRVADAGHAE